MRSSRSNLATDSFFCKVRLLDDAEINFEYKRESPGKNLMDFVAGQLDLIEKDYFGLRFVDNNKQRHWLDSNKEISKQLKDCRQPYMFFFRVKFYPTDPTKLKEEITRYQLYLQLKRDILHGRLLCPFNNITDLAAHIVQAEVGDFDDQEHGRDYLSNIKLLPRQNDRLEEKIMEYHKTLKGYSPIESENRFLNLARSQDLYGVDPHPCKDQEDLPLYLGLTPQGIQIIREARRVSGFVWRDVNKVSYDSKIFYIQVQTEKKKTNYAFRLNDASSCKHLWKCAVEHMTFYSEEPIKAQGPKRSALSPHNIFRRSKYKYSGKTEQELKNVSEKIRRSTPPSFERKSTLRLSVVLSNTKQFQSMPSLVKMPHPYTTPVDDNSNKEMRDSTDDQSITSSKDGVALNDTLQEFETKDFPTDSESNRQSLEMDDGNSTSSSIDISSSNNILPLVTPVINVMNVDDEDPEKEDQSNGHLDQDDISEQASTPSSQIRTLSSATELIAPTTSPKATTTSATVTTAPTTFTSPMSDQKIAQLEKLDAYQKNNDGLRSNSLVNDLTQFYKNPLFILLVLAVVFIPIAFFVQFKLNS